MPIHKGSVTAYYESNRIFVEDEKKKLESQLQWNRPWKEIPPDVKARWEDYWRCPPWFFNEIVGFLDVGMDRGSCMTANIYLRRKYFPRDKNPMDTFGPGTTLENQEFWYYAEVRKRNILDMDDNGSFVAEIQKLIADAQEILAQIKKGSKYHVWQFPFSWKHINFAKALPEAQSRELIL